MSARNIQKVMNHSTFGMPVVVSLILHIGIIAFITINIDWSKEDEIMPAPIQAFVVNDYTPKKIKPSQRVNIPDPKVELEKQKAEQLAQEKAAQEKVQQEEALRLKKEKEAAEEKEKERLEKEKLEKEKQDKLEKERIEKEKIEKQKAEEERLLQEALKAEEAELERLRQEELNSELNAEQSRLAQLNTEYKYAIRDKISRNWNKPITVKESFQCEVLVKQIPGGEIVNVAVKSCNGDAIFKSSVENALRKVKTLPYTGYEEVFNRDIEFTFKPE